MKNKKKKYIIIVSAVVVCAVIFALAIKAQNVYTSTISNKQASAEKAQNKSDSTAQSGKSQSGDKNGKENSDVSGKSSKNPASSSLDGTSKVNSKAGQTSSTQGGSSQNSNVPGAGSQKSVEQSSIEIIDEVHGNRVVLRKNLNGIDGQTVGYVTQKILDGAKISYTTKGTGSTIYFSNINGLKERAEGPMSGWCYYVKKKGQSQFIKANIGSGQYVLKSGDSVIWKYVKNGM